MVKFITAFVIGALVLYALILLLLYRYQERLIFVPTRLAADHVFSFARPHREVFIDVPNARLNGLVFEHPNARGTILYYHGNAGALDTWGDVAQDFAPFPYHVLVLDYRGYGKSTGTIESESQLHQDALAVYDYAQAHLNTDEIVIVGRSIGTGVAARLAAEHQPNILILETPYYSFPDLVKSIYPVVPSALIRYRLNTAHWIESLNMPIHLIHGDEDPLIPFSSSQRLKAINPKVKLHTITGAVHNNISEFELYHRALKSILGSQ